MIKKISLDYTELEIYPHFCIARTHEGVNVDLSKHLQVIELISQEIPHPFGFIIDEINTYSVDFAVMQHMNRDPHIACGAIVAHRYTTIKALASAIRVIGKPVRVCKSVEDARSWVMEFLQKHHPELFSL